MNQHFSLSPRRNLLASQVARGFTHDKISPISQKVSPMRVTQMILAATFALALPEQSLSQEISDDRIKALVAETLRENPELVLEALQAEGFALPVLTLGLPDVFIEHGDPAKLLAQLGLDATGIERSVRERFGAALQAAAHLKIVGASD